MSIYFVGGCIWKGGLCLRSSFGREEVAIVFGVLRGSFMSEEFNYFFERLNL